MLKVWRSKITSQNSCYEASDIKCMSSIYYVLKAKNIRLKRVKGRWCFPKESCVYPSLSVNLLGKLWRISVTEDT